MNFGEALEAVKKGKAVKRKDWINKFIFRRPEDLIDAEIVIKQVKSLPKVVKDFYSKNYDSKNVYFSGYICLKDEEDYIRNGWLPTQADLFAETWEIIEE